MTSKLAELIDDYMEASQTYNAYWGLYQHSHAASGRHVLEVLKALEDDIAKFTHAARRYFYTKHAGMQLLIMSYGNEVVK